MNYLYVCHFSNGHIKVGRSSHPQARIATHEARVSCLGVEVADSAIFECAGGSFAPEAALIQKCRELLGHETNNHRGEWFSGLEFEDVCRWAQVFASDDLMADVGPTEKPRKQAPLGLATALNDAITKAGGLAAFTESVEAPSTHAVKQWRIAGVPEKYCPRIERVTGIRCELLRPDVEWAVLRNSDSPAKQEA